MNRIESESKILVKYISNLKSVHFSFYEPKTGAPGATGMTGAPGATGMTGSGAVATSGAQPLQGKTISSRPAAFLAAFFEAFFVAFMSAIESSALASCFLIFLSANNSFNQP